MQKLIQTSHGPLEYAVLGEGLPLVVMHGSCGGVRQGLMMRCLFDTRRIQIIALSRPGYRGTPLETAPEIEQQADRVVEIPARRMNGPGLPPAPSPAQR